ncbi:MAG: hypothetical protein V4622_12930 [Bacteroidota bacterium]
MRGTKLRNNINLERLLIELKEKTDAKKPIEEIKEREKYALRQIQASYDRIHDKVFNLNNITLGIFLVLSTFPQEKPILSIWSLGFPMATLIYIIFLDWQQMQINTFASRETEWTDEERKEYPDKVRIQGLLTMWSFFFSYVSVLYLILTIIKHQWK